MITIIGNGESRKTIDVDKIRGMRVGCNAIYQYHSVDFICAMDRFWRDKIIKETSIPLISRLHNMAAQNTLELFDHKWYNTEVPYRGYCSGITALDYMCTLYKDDIYLIGFDFGYKGKTVNHIYKGTQNHPASTRPAQNENIFLNECLDTIKRHCNHKIYWVTDSDFYIKINKMRIDDYKRIACR